MPSVKAKSGTIKGLKKAPDTHKYIFTIHSFDENNVVELTATIKTKLVTAKTAGKLLNDQLFLHMPEHGRFCYSIERNGIFLNPKDLK